MIALALTVALTSSTGSLSDINPAQRHARFIESPVEFAGSSMLGAAERPYDLMSLPELEAERAKLEDSRHGLGGGIALVILGPVAVITGAVLIAVGALNFSAVLITIGYVLAIVGGLMAAAGIALIVAFSVANGTINRKIRQVDTRIQQLRMAPPPGYAPPPPGGVPPPPPPSTQNFSPVAPQLTVAEF